MDTLSKLIAEAVEKLERHGLTVSGQKPLPYGQQVIVTDGSGKVNINFYTGKKGFSTVIGGAAGSALRQKVIDILNISANKDMGKTATQSLYGFEDITGFDYRWLGTDEAGKGDCFGPLVIAGVMVDAKTAAELENNGIRDSKALSDGRIGQLAQAIKEICQGKFVELELVPSRYNALYRQFKSEGKNLNHLLAWGHARVLEDLLRLAPCRFALVDQFADEKYIKAALLTQGQTITLRQIPRAERNVAVAAASILARHRFVQRMQQLEEKYGMEFPKGASAAVITAAQEFVKRYGNAALTEVAKLHFKTFAEFL